MGLPSASGNGYELEDGNKWDAVTFDLFHATSYFHEDVLNVKISERSGLARFLVTNLSESSMKVFTRYILDDKIGKVYTIKPGKKKELVGGRQRRQVLYYRFED